MAFSAGTLRSERNSICSLHGRGQRFSLTVLRRQKRDSAPDMYERSVLITDVDNTLLDWVTIWHASFSPMLAKLIDKSGISAELLIPEIRSVHQRHGTSEYAFLINEVPLLKEAAGDADVREFYADAIGAFRQARRQSLALYSGVMDFLLSVKSRGTLIVAYTESKAFYTEYRFRKLGLDKVVDYLYSPPDHELPIGVTKKDLRRYPDSQYEMERTEHRYTPDGELKPNPKILSDILTDIGARRDQAVYVGDSLMKDIVMAKDVGILDAHAAYGAAQHTEAYSLLKSVTHWTKEDVRREARINQHPPVKPSRTLASRLDELSKSVIFKGFESERIS